MNTLLQSRDENGLLDSSAHVVLCREPEFYKHHSYIAQLKALSKIHTRDGTGTWIHVQCTASYISPLCDIMWVVIVTVMIECQELSFDWLTRKRDMLIQHNQGSAL